MDVSHAGHRQRLRDRCRLSGFDSLSEYEKLEFLLFAYIPRKNTNDIAHRLIERFGSFAKVLDSREEDLASVKGMTTIAAQYLSTLPGVVVSYREDKINKKQYIHNSASAIEVFKIHIGMRTTEIMQVLCLNVKRQLIHTITLESKSAKMVILRPADLICEIVRHNTNHIIIGHNHPSGDVTPSREDIDFVRTMQKALNVLNIELVDSIIVGLDKSFSFRNADMLRDEGSAINDGANAADAFLCWGKKHRADFE